MVDNTTLDAGSGGDTLRTEDRTTFKTPVSIIDVGGTSAEALLGDAGNFMPITFAVGSSPPVGAGTEAAALRVTLPTDGTGVVGLAAGTAGIGKLTANSGVTIGAVEIAAAQTLATVTTVSTVTNIAQLGGQSVSMGTGVRDAGTQRVTVATDDAVPVTGTFFQATQPVSLASVPSHAVTGPLTDTELRATSVPVSVDDIHVVDLDTSGSTENCAAVGVLFASALGAVPVSAANPLPIDIATGNVAATSVTGAVSTAAGTEYTPKFAAISAASSGDNTLVAAVVGKKIRVLAYILVAKTAVDVRFEDGASGTALSGVMSFGDTGGATPSGYSPGQFETSANTLLNLELSAAVQVSGHMTYVEVD